MNLALIMLKNSVARRRECEIVPPALRRQVAGDLDNPFDLKCHDNRDLKLFIQDYLKHFEKNPSVEELNSVALFPADENLLQLQLSLSKL
jgi:hypothetical protein